MSVSKHQILEDIRRVASELQRIPTRDEYAGRFKKPLGRFTETEIKKWFASFSEAVQASGVRAKYSINVVDKDGLQIAQLKDELTKQRGYINELEAEVIDTKKIRNLIGAIDTTQLGGRADWLRGPKELKSGITGIPTLFISDVHFGEVVKPEQINGVNAFNNTIARERIRHTFKTAIELTKKYLFKPHYDGFICALGGDILSGSIHEELAETNDLSVNRAILDITNLMIEGIGWVADEFGRVFVPCVAGNHGRQHKKPRFKYKMENNYEWLVYQYLSMHFKKDDRVTFYIPDAPDAQWSCYGRTYNLNHGDQFKGGTGIAGLFSPLMLGMARKQKKQNAIGQPFDVMLNGHWHQYIHTDSLIVNGSIKGYDEYANGLNLPFEPPQQALWISHPSKRETFRMPVLCNPDSKGNSKGSKLSWPGE